MAYHASLTIVSVTETLVARQLAQYSPTFMYCTPASEYFVAVVTELRSVYHMSTVLVTLQAQAKTAVPSFLPILRAQVKIALRFLHTISEIWPMAASIAEFAESLLNDRYFHQQFVRRMTEYRHLELDSGLYNVL